jgi:hypothetical protein
LDRQRNLEAAQAAESDKNVVTNIVDAIRGSVQQPEAQQPQVQQQAEQPQAQPEAQPPTDEQMLQAALERPAVRQALEAQLNTVEQQRAQYAKAAGEAFELAHASLFSQYPELQNVSGGNLPAVLNVLRHNNPARYADVVNALQQTDKLHTAATQAKAQEAQIAEARQKMWVASEEKRFESEVLAKESPATIEAVKRNGSRILSENYGVSVDQLKEVFATNPALRSAPMQAALFDLIKTKLTQEAIATKKAPPAVPPVMRPGVSRPAPSHDDEEAKSALARFKADPNPKAANRRNGFWLGPSLCCRRIGLGPRHRHRLRRSHASFARGIARTTCRRYSALGEGIALGVAKRRKARNIRRSRHPIG